MFKLLLEQAAEQLNPTQDSAQSPATPAAWDAWLRALFPAYVAHPFADRHRALWGWAESIALGAPCEAFVGCWGRGGAKSTNAELIVVRWGATRVRRYGIYLSETQEQADDHVGNIAALLESPALAAHHPHLADRLIGKFGQSKGWRRNRLRTSDGFTVDALGLDTAARGIKLEEMRPDFLIIDDIDGAEDSERVTAKKARTLTRTILPALTHDAAVLFIENRVHDDSLMSQVLDGRADFLTGAIISGPHPAIRTLQLAGSAIVGGDATWEGQTLEDCQRFILKWGLDAFLSECQHQSIAQAGRFLAAIGLWDACEHQGVPELDAHTPIVLGVDAGESSDTFAIVGVSRWGAGLAVRFSRIYVPTEGKALDFDQIERDIRGLVKRYAVRELTYDRFLLGQTMRRFQETPLPTPLEPFNQGNDRLEADKALLDFIATRTLVHDGTHSDLRGHLDNANAKRSADGRQLRIVKRGARKIDGAVALAMATARAAALLLHGPSTPARPRERKSNVWRQA